MAYGTKYRLPFTNNLGEDYDIQLNLKDYVGDAIILEGSGSTMTMQSFGSDDDRFTPISSKGVTITTWINENQTIGIADFLATEDDQWNVRIIRDPVQPPIFDGFLVIEDSLEPLLDRPFELVLRASDGLSLLKDVPLKKSDGTDFNGYNSFTDYIGHILHYIKDDIHFKVYFDIYHADMNIAECPLEQCGVTARSFEKDETSFQDSYAALEFIMKSLECTCYYESGFWHIVSRWQYAKDYGFNWTEYNIVSNAVTKVDSMANDMHDVPIGKDKNLFLINKDALKYYKVATKSVKLNFNYDFPRTFVPNQTFTGGTLLPAQSGAGYEGFTLDHWIHQRGFPAMVAPSTGVAHIHREFDAYNNEKERYVILPNDTGFANAAHLLSTTDQGYFFYISEGDKITISIDTRLKNHYGGSQTSQVMYVMLTGENGTYWFLQENSAGNPQEGLWFASNSTFTSNIKLITHFYAAGDNKSDWNTVSVSSYPAPATGTIQIVLAEHSFSAYPNETWFRDLRIEYHPYIRGSYKPVTGDYNYYNQDLKINKTIDDPVTISDSPKKIIKGTIFVNGLLGTPQWFRTGFAESLRFTQIMALIKYTFNYRQFCKIEGTVKGLSLLDSSGNNIPFGFLPQYSLSDIVQPTTRYILTSISEINYLTGQWRGILVEVQLNPVATFDKYDFSYIF